MGFSVSNNPISVASQQVEKPKPDICHEQITSSNGNIATYLSKEIYPAKGEAEERNPNTDNNGEDVGIFGAIQSFFDPTEQTKSGKVLPKAYLESAREVVKTIRESLEEDSKDTAKFRRTADAAKESIREYLNDWRGKPSVSTQESYVAIEKAIRCLASFYSKAGPFGAMPDDIKANILNDLNTAESFL